VEASHFSPQNSQEMDWDLHPELRGKTPLTSRMKIIYKNSVLTSKRTRYFSTTKTNQLDETISCTLCARCRIFKCWYQVVSRLTTAILRVECLKILFLCLIIIIMLVYVTAPARVYQSLNRKIFSMQRAPSRLHIAQHFGLQCPTYICSIPLFT